MPAVVSSAIERVEYDAPSQRMSVWFGGSRRYVYESVPAAVYCALMTATSKGRYFNEHVRDRYRFR